MSADSSNKSSDKLSKLLQKKASIESEMKRLKLQMAERARKRKSKALLQAGRLVDAAGLAEEDSGFLLGALLDLAEKREDQALYSKLKTRGDKALKERGMGVKKKARSYNVPHPAI